MCGCLLCREQPVVPDAPDQHTWQVYAALPVGVVHVSTHNLVLRAVYVNPVAEAMFGYSCADITSPPLCTDFMFRSVALQRRPTAAAMRRR